MRNVSFCSRTSSLRSRCTCGYYLQNLAFSMNSRKQASDLLSCFDRVVLFSGMPFSPPPSYPSSDNTAFLVFFFFFFGSGLRKWMNNELKAGTGQGFKARGSNPPEESGPGWQPSPCYDCWSDCLQMGPHWAPEMGTRSETRLVNQVKWEFKAVLFTTSRSG